MGRDVARVKVAQALQYRRRRHCLSNEDEGVMPVEYDADLEDTKTQSDEVEQGVEQDATMLTVNTKLLDCSHQDEAVDSDQPPFQKPLFSNVIFERPSLHQLLADSLNQDSTRAENLESDGKSTTTLNCSSVGLSSSVAEVASFPEDMNPWELL